jgi:hypothetical protein
VALTRDELRAGLVRLGIVVAVVIGLVAAGGIALWMFGGGAHDRALALAFSLAGAILVGAGAVAGLSATKIGMERSHGQRRQVLRSPEDRHDRELLAYGLIGFGVVSFIVALALG